MRFRDFDERHVRIFLASLFLILHWPLEAPAIFRVQNTHESLLRPAYIGRIRLTVYLLNVCSVVWRACFMSKEL
jgi:hypothetical protein